MEPRLHKILENAVLEGEQVLVRPHVAEDAEAAFALTHRREAVLRWLLWSGPETVEELESFYRAWRVGTHDADDYHFAICRRSDEELVGSIGLRFIGHPGTGDVGYWVGEPHWNHGYASEAVKLVSHLAFEHLDAHALTSWVFLGNDSSRRVLEKAGFRYVRTSTRGHQGRDPVPEWSLALLRDEWKGREQVWKPRSESVIAVP